MPGSYFFFFSKKVCQGKGKRRNSGSGVVLTLRKRHLRRDLNEGRNNVGEELSRKQGT